MRNLRNFDIVVRISSYDGKSSALKVECWLDEQDRAEGTTPEDSMYVIIPIRDGKVNNGLVDYGHLREEMAIHNARNPCFTSKGLVSVRS